MFFENVHPDQVSGEVLEKLINEFGFVTVNYLTLFEHPEKSLRERAAIAMEEIKKYQFFFIQERFGDSIEKFNQENPFDILLANRHDNRLTAPKDHAIGAPLRKYLEERLALEIDLVRSAL
jgi:hypothetical protein